MKAKVKNNKNQEYLVDKKRDAQLNHLLLESRNELKILYKTKITDNEKYTAKKRIFSLMQNKYTELKKTWSGNDIHAYDDWMQQGLNNSHLLLFATYYDLVPAFETIEQAQDLATQWLWTYNNERSHTSIGGIPPRQLLNVA